MLGKLDQYLQFNQTALSLRSSRQEVLASNIANADTPNYKARDFDFTSALNGAMASSTAAAAVGNSTGAGAAAADSGTTAMPALSYRAPAQGAVDGNTVDMDVERNQFADNSIRYEAGLNAITGQIKNMLAAIQAAP